MMIFKKAIPRRTFLARAGAALAFALLDSMVPAFATTADTAATPAVRMGFVYVPNESSWANGRRRRRAPVSR